jgi:hypothetical protein
MASARYYDDFEEQIMNSFLDIGINIDESKSGNQKTICPICSANRKNSTDPCLSVNAVEGVYNCHNCGWKGSIKNGNGNSGKVKSEIETTYDYKDENGKLLYQSVRFVPKSFRQRRSDGNGDWIWDLKGVQRVPYRLPELIANTEPVYIPGGEKDVETLVKHGLTATTNAGGEGNWKPEFNEYLRGRNVVILEDNDEKGRKHGRVISESLYGIASRVKIIRFEELDKGDDVTDYLQTNSYDDLVVRVKATSLFEGSYIKYFGNEDKREPPEKSPEQYWEDPILFGQIETPDIRFDVLPSWLGDYARAVSENTQTPSGMAVMLALSVTATCLQKRFVVSPYGDDYAEPLALWTATILPPATRKTAVVNAMTAPLSDWEHEMAVKFKDEIADNETLRTVNLKTIEQLQNKAAKENNSIERLSYIEEINQLKSKTPDEKYPPRLWTGDVTPERLQNLLVEHGERMSLLSDEGGIFEIMAGLYSNGVANIDIFLKAHAGSPARVDRGNRSAHVDSPALSFGLAIQPEVASQLSNGNKKHFRGNGTLARFLYCLPNSNVGKRDVTRRTVIPETIKVAYRAGIFHLLDIVDIVDENGVGKPRILRLDDDALGSWLKFAQYVESNQGQGGDFESFQDWTGKLPGVALRIAGLCHVVEHGSDNHLINKATLERALDLCELLIKHARATFDLMGADEAIADAQHVLKWILGQGGPFFKRSDCQKDLRGRFRRVNRLLKALEALTERHIISNPETLPTKKPTIVYYINPKILEEDKHGLA